MSITLSIILVFLLTLGGSTVQISSGVCPVHPARSVSVLKWVKTPGTTERTPEKSINPIPASTIGRIILFQGREYDDKVNLYYYRARYYEPVMGRFLQTDPMGYQDSMNLYQGLNMNPVNFVDPMGEEKEFNVMVMGGMSCKDAERIDNASKDAMGTGASMLADFFPVIGDVKGIFEGVVGKDIMGNKLEWWERGLAILCISELRHVDDIAKIGGKAGKIADTVHDIDNTIDSMGDKKKIAKKATDNVKGAGIPVKMDANGRWHDAIGKFIKFRYPDNRGFEYVTKEALQPGSRLDRYGGYLDEAGKFIDEGTFASPEGVPFPQRLLPPAAINKPYSVYEVLKPIIVDAGPAIPWFGQTGKGIQYELPLTISELLKKGFIKKVN